MSEPALARCDQCGGIDMIEEVNVLRAERVMLRTLARDLTVALGGQVRLVHGPIANHARSLIARAEELWVIKPEA